MGMGPGLLGRGWPRHGNRTWVCRLLSSARWPGVAERSQAVYPLLFKAASRSILRAKYIFLETERWRGGGEAGEIPT